MRAMRYEMESGLLKNIIDERRDFFIGGRGVGIRFYFKGSGFWELEIERAATIIHADDLKVVDGLLEVFDEGGNNLIARIDLAHYLKVAVIW